MTANAPYLAVLEGRFCLVRIPGIADGRQIRRIELSPKPGVIVPAAYQSLSSEILRTLTVLDLLFPDQSGRFFRQRRQDRAEQRFREYFGKLAGLTLVALGQDQVALGVLNLRELQTEIVNREASSVKNKYMRSLGCWALSFAALFGLLFLGSRQLDLDTIFFRYRDIFVMVTGSFLGSWLSFGVRHARPGFADLTRLEDDLLDPPMRLVFVAAMTAVIGLLLFQGVIKVTAGGFDTMSVERSGASALLIGVFCGLCEKALPGVLSRHSAEMVGMLAGSGSDATREHAAEHHRAKKPPEG
jgi:hypothetical protein